jgi:hypothetical protein
MRGSSWRTARRPTAPREAKMLNHWKEGDTAPGSCPHCKHAVTTRFERRTYYMQRTRLRVPDVLVDVCTECDFVLSVPPQSIAQLRETGIYK